VASDYLNHADAYSNKTFRCNQKHLWGIIPAFRRTFSLSRHVSVAGKNFPKPRCRGSSRDNSCCLSDLVIQGTTATHGFALKMKESEQVVGMLRLMLLASRIYRFIWNRAISFRW